MRALATFAMKGRSQAAMATTVLAILALIVPLFSILSSAIVGLVTLRKGHVEGLLVGALSSMAAAVLAYLLLGSPSAVVGFMLVLWLPAWGIGWLLRASRSLPLSLMAGAGFGLLLLVLMYAGLGDPQARWQEVMQPVAQDFVDKQLLLQDQVTVFVEFMSAWMTGMIATGFYLQLILALLLARAWQADLFNPGGFRDEFHALGFGKAFGLAGMILVAPAALQPGTEASFIRDLAMLVAPLLVMQGLAVAHRTVAVTRMSVGWLVALYTLMLFAMPHTALLVGLMGLADVFVDFRSRLKPSDDAPEP